MLKNNIKSIIYEMDLSNIFTNKKQFDDSIKYFQDLINNLIESNKDLFKSSGKFGAFNIYDISDFSKNIDKLISDIKIGHYSNDIYNKLIESGIDKNKLNNIIIELLNDIRNIKNINEIESILKSKTLEAISKFRDKLAEIQYNEVEELKKNLVIPVQNSNNGLLLGGGILVLSLFGMLIYSLFNKKISRKN
jgi:hypothetical protein